METANEVAPVRDFANRRAFVTGAGSGIGEGIALRLAAAGARIACVDLDGAEAGRVAGVIEAAGGEACAVVCDVADGVAVTRAMEEATAALGGLDVLVNNAGIVKVQRFEDTSVADWDRTFAVNLRSLFLTCRAALPHLRASEAAAIVNIASIAALRYTVPHVDYASTKAGVVSFTRDLAYELGGDGIRVNAVAPGPVATGMMATISDEDVEEAGARFVLGRMGRPEDVAEAVAFLASSRAAYITGATLPVTGGAELATRPLRPEDA